MAESRARYHAARLFLVCWLLAGCATTPEQVTPEATAPEAGPTGLYTNEQADRGERVFTMICSTCHGRTEFTGAMFQMTWMREPIGSLFQHISAAMPQDNPGSLSPEEYASVVAYLLRLNERPAGTVELPSDPEVLGELRW